MVNGPYWGVPNYLVNLQKIQLLNPLYFLSLFPSSKEVTVFLWSLVLSNIRHSVFKFIYIMGCEWSRKSKQTKNLHGVASPIGSTNKFNFAMFCQKIVFLRCLGEKTQHAWLHALFSYYL